MRRIDLAVLVLLGFALASFAAVGVRSGQDRAETVACANNLSQLWKMQGNYMVQFGGPQKKMPVETGDAFWLKLSNMNPPLIDASLRDIYQCPVENVDDGPGTCDYRGPASDVNGADVGDGDPVGADVDGNHGVGKGGSVLRKAGDVQTCGAEDALWQSAAKKTKGGNPATPPKVNESEFTPKQQRAVVDMGHIAIALFLYDQMMGSRPETLRDLVQPPKDAQNWPEGGFYPGGRIPKDPWGGEYQFRWSGREPKIWTWGADGKEGGEGENEDVDLESVFRGRRGGSAGASAERNAMGTIKTLATAQADFRSNDRDCNRVQDFWTGDVAGLYCIDNTSTGAEKPSMIKLIELSVALADHAPISGLTIQGENNYSKSVETLGKRAPKAGYWYLAMKEDLQVTANGGDGTYRQNTGVAKEAVYNTSRFGFCAFPAEYGKSGKKTFIINEGNTLFWKDTGGKPVENWPTDAELAKDWKVAD